MSATGSENVEEMVVLASDPKTDPDVLGKLSMSDNEAVVRAALANPSTPMWARNRAARAASSGAGLGATVAGERTCPHCAETIKAAASVCRYCGRDIRVGPGPTPVRPPQGGMSTGAKWALGLLAVAIAGGGLFAVNAKSQADEARRIEEAKRAADVGANLGGPANTGTTVYDLLCPDGPLTAPVDGVDCSRQP